jgi:two-component system cell cycle sensor histidine kinase/response regulator CckA
MHTPTVFLVEDEQSLRVLVRKVLERFGCRVVEASSGEEALEKWNQEKQQIDLLLTDLMLPDGMNGRDLAEKLLEENPNLKVVFTTGYSYEEACKGLPLPDGFHFLQKPYPPSTLLQTIKVALTAKPQQQALAA